MRQLRAMNLSPGGHDPVAQLTWRNKKRKVWLYRIDLAKPKRVPTLAQEWALDQAMAARQSCPVCRVRFDICLQAAVLHRMQHISRCATSLSCRWCPGYDMV